jgi:glycosyltransferase involved in cell wall biosynthesis
MRVAIDLTALLPRATGVDTYLKHLVIHLGHIDHDNRYVIFMNYEDRRLFDGMLPQNFAVLPLCLRPRPARLLFQQIGLPTAARALGSEVVHSPSFFMPFYRGRQRHLLTVYDMTFFSLPHCHTPLHRSTPFRRMVSWSIRHADQISVPSRATQQAILDLMPEVSPERIRVIRPGISEEFTPEALGKVQAEIRRLGALWPYILYVGTIEPRKNLQRLVESYRRLIAGREIDEHLVLAGPLGWDAEALLRQVDAPELRDRVHLLGYMPQSDLPWLYRGAKVFVYPSLQEGFGFPPLEAMACGVPTIASLTSSLAENLQGAVELVPPTDGEALTWAMRRLLCDEHLRAERREQGLARAAQFRWQEAAQQTLRCYQDLAAGG